MKITTLAENTKLEKEGLGCENGLSFFLETQGKKILFDCGQTNLFLKNAQAISVAPKADIVILSHGHFDHANGFPSYVEYHDAFDLYLGEGFFQTRHSVEPNQIRDLSANFGPQLFEKPNILVHTISQDKTEIAPHLFLVKNFQHTCSLEQPPKRMQIVTEDGGYAQDLFPDEICLVEETEKGLIVIVGCSHPGIVNMLTTIRSRFDNQPIYAVIGGTHFRDATPEQIENAIAYLQESGVSVLGLSHCSGDISPYLGENTAQYFRFCSGTIKEI